jgi:hypothetical protein
VPRVLTRYNRISLHQGLQPSAHLHDLPTEILEAIFVAAASSTRTRSTGGVLMVWPSILHVTNST